MSKEYKFEPDYVSPPGESLRDCLSALGMSVASLSTKTEISVGKINSILDGTAAITPWIARKLEQVVGGSDMFWLNLESQYRTGLERFSR